ncbi:MAG: hypothetical protein ACXVP2_09530 [Tumebacillaceae bacterium]
MILGSLWMFLADLFFMAIIFAGVGLLIRYVLHQTVGTMEEKVTISRKREFVPLFEKHQDSTPIKP